MNFYLFTQITMKKTLIFNLKKIIFTIISSCFILPFLGFQYSFANGNFSDELEQSIQGINGMQVIDNAKWTEWVTQTIFKLLDIAQPIILAIGVLMAFIGAYKIMASGEADQVKTGWTMIIVGVVGVIIIVSAKFIGNTLVSDVIGSATDKLNGIAIAERLYDKLLLPFLKIAMYLAMGFLFFVLAARVFSFMTSSDEGIKKKAWGMILRSTIWIAIIMLSKQLIEAIFGKREQILNISEQNGQTISWITNLGEMGNELLETDLSSSLPLVYSIINWVMGLTALVILILIIIQTIGMLTHPDDAELVKKIRKTITYVFIGVIVIGAWYLISNTLLIDGQS